MKQFDGRVAVITGAGSGIGAALAEQLGHQGCRLALADRCEVGLAEVADRLKPHGITLSTHAVDVAERNQVERFAKDVVEAHGAAHLVINNAGIGLADYVETVDYADFERVMQVNFWGVVYGTKAFLPYLKRVDEAHIVNISSLFGLGALPTQAVYNASKFAVRGFTEALKMELADTQVRVSSVHPGGVRTNIARNSTVSEASVRLRKDLLVERFETLARTSPERAAQIIIRGIRKNRRRILVGWDAWLADKIIRWFPSTYEYVLRLEQPLHKRRNVPR